LTCDKFEQRVDAVEYLFAGELALSKPEGEAIVLKKEGKLARCTWSARKTSASET